MQSQNPQNPPPPSPQGLSDVRAASRLSRRVQDLSAEFISDLQEIPVSAGLRCSLMTKEMKERKEWENERKLDRKNQETGWLRGGVGWNIQRNGNNQNPDSVGWLGSISLVKVMFFTGNTPLFYFLWSFFFFAWISFDHWNKERLQPSLGTVPVFRTRNVWKRPLASDHVSVTPSGWSWVCSSDTRISVQELRNVLILKNTAAVPLRSSFSYTGGSTS